jgi:[citrate (pro-3S)-lyase] ligase
MVRRQVEDFLGSNGLRLGEVDLYLAVLSADGAILAGGGLQRDILKCLAVSAEARSLGLSVPLISRLLSVASERGYTNVKVFTKPENLSVFESLGFKLLASAPKAILLENGRGLADYCAYLRAHPAPGVIIMNANPFTLGHRYLVDQASLSFRAPEGRRNLTIIPVKEDASRFPYTERLAMLRAGAGDLADVVEGSDYQISAATFPTYFLKNLSDAAETQMRLDIDLFGRHIAPALGARVRFVGTEPADPLTARYNALLKELLPNYGVQLVEIPRLTCTPNCTEDSSTPPSASLRMTRGTTPEPVAEPVEAPALRQAQGPVTATEVRALVDEGRFKEASALTPASTWPYLLAELAERALRMELDTPMKPGLVGPDSVGAHKDMDYDVMRKGIAAIRPFFPQMALAGTPEELRQLGIDAEAAMLAATGGVNTHRGAIFALGLALNAALRTFAAAGQPPHPALRTLSAAQPLRPAESRPTQLAHNEQVMRNSLVQMYQGIYRNQLKANGLGGTQLSHGGEVVRQYGVKGARELASEGYQALFEDWLPYYRNLQISPLASLGRNDKMREICMLLRIMATLDDTCVIHRVGYARAMEVKEEAMALLKEIPGQAGNDEEGQAGNDKGVMADLIGHLKAMCERYAAEGISPGGAADMLALTILIDSILN